LICPINFYGKLGVSGGAPGWLRKGCHIGRLTECKRIAERLAEAHGLFL
jgi:hypothetical protein